MSCTASNNVQSPVVPALSMIRNQTVVLQPFRGILVRLKAKVPAAGVGL